MPEEKKVEEQKGLSRREFARKIAQGMVAFLVVASVGRGYAATCSGEPDVDCKPDGTEIDENCGSQKSLGGGKYTYDIDDHCSKKIGTSQHQDKDDACGVGSAYNGTLWARATDDNCGSTYGVRDQHDYDDNCGNWFLKSSQGTLWTPDFGCSPEPNYDKDENCGKQWPTTPPGGTDIDNDGKT